MLSPSSLAAPTHAPHRPTDHVRLPVPVLRGALTEKRATLSHKTGKRVLTASTTLALAAVGLAAMPLTAHAAAGDITNGCGLNDIVDTADTTTYVKYSLNGGSTFTPITYNVNGSGVKQPNFSLASIPGAYAKDGSGNDIVNPQFFIYDALNQSKQVTGLLTKTICSLSIGTGTNAPVPGTPGTWSYKAPTAAETGGGVAGGTVTLYYSAGVSWHVTDNAGLNVTVTPSMFSATTPGASTYTVNATGSSASVTATPVDANYTLNPPSNTWNFVLDGVTDVTYASGAPSQTGATISLQGATGAAWYVTDTSVAGATLAKNSGVSKGAGPTTDTLASGQTMRYWLIADATHAFADGSTYKYWDFSWTDTSTLITLDPASIKFNDGAVTSDSVTVPTIAGLKFYVTLATPTGAFNPTNIVLTPAAAAVADKWMLVSETTNLGADATGKTATVVAVQDNTASTDIVANAKLFTSYDAATTALSVNGDGPVYVKSPRAYDGTKTTVYPAAPSYSDVNDPNADSFTTPAFSPNVTYTITANGVSSSGLLPGTTYTRQQWAAVFPTLDVSADVAFVVVPAPSGGSFQLPMELTAAALNAAPWKKTVTVGSQITAPAPTFIENVDVSGTKYDVIKFQNTPNYTYTVGTWTDTDSGKTWTSTDTLAALASAITATTDASGVTTYYVANTGVKVGVKVTPAAGVVLANADGFATAGGLATLATDKVFTTTFLSGNIVTPVAPVVTDKAGTADDTYTLVGVTGVTYYVNGQPFDMSKVNIPQSTGGADKITVTATVSGSDVFPDGTKSKAYPLTFDISAGPGTPTVDHDITSAAPPTAHVTWSADNAASYKVTYQKLLSNGQRGPELTWYADTDKTDANFVAMRGDEYFVRVVAMDADGNESEASETFIQFPGTEGLQDIKPGNGTFGGSWDYLTNLLAGHNLPYFGDTAALGYTNSSYTVTLPAGAKSFDLYATVHKYGAKGAILVNGVYWADFQTNSGYWGPVTDPYQYPVRTVSGWTANQVTIKVIVTENSANYVALDAYNAH